MTDTVKIDLHTHSNVSDGLHPPEKVAENALKCNLDYFALTDHDSVGGLDKARKVLSGTSCRFIEGIECSTAFDGHETHILGYFPDGIPESISGVVGELQANREARAIQGLRNLKKIGVKLTIEDVLPYKTGEILSRSHIAKALIEHRIAKNFHDVFSNFLGNDVGVFPPSRTHPHTIIEYFKKEGALSVWAHPDINVFDEAVKEMVEKGLCGVEISTKYGDPRNSQYFERVADDMGLYMTYGSDWHGFGSEPIKGFEIECERIEPFLKHFA